MASNQSSMQQHPHRDGSWTRWDKCNQVIACAMRINRATKRAGPDVRMLVDFKLAHAHALMNEAHRLVAHLDTDAPLNADTTIEDN